MSRSRLQNLRTALWHLRAGGIEQWRRYRGRQKVNAGAVSLDGSQLDADGHRTFPPWPIPNRAPVRPGLRVGVVLDDFSRIALQYEWDQVVLKPGTWRQQVSEPLIDLLFVESAWHGNHDAWQYHLTGPSAPRPALVELIEWCRSRGVPTVFWNKEDPAHFEDFLECARLFDHVFTTDSNKMHEYRKRLGHDRVNTLMFAAQPAIHNPMRPKVGHQSRDIAFAGMYFAHKYPERRAQMDLLLGAAARVSPRMEHGLEIYSRRLGSDEKYQFPPPLNQKVVGSLSYERMLTAYRAHKVFLNVNSVVTSPSMCARRIFEITAAGSSVVSTPAPAIDQIFPNREIAQVSTPEEAEFTLRALVRNAGLRERQVHKAQRWIWQAHTYGHRVDQVLRAVGHDEHTITGTTPKVSALVSTNRPQQVEHVLSTLASQRDVDLQVVILTHGFELDETGLRDQAREIGLGEVRLQNADADLSLGECLNRLVRAADGDILAKIDDDDHYGPHYLADSVHALGYANADLVGKQAHYLYLSGADVTVLRMPEREHIYTDRVMGPTMVFTDDLARSVPFQSRWRGEDTAFLAETCAAGGVVYSADRFNFLQTRQSDPATHTWAASDLELMAGSLIEIHGDLSAHVVN